MTKTDKEKARVCELLKNLLGLELEIGQIKLPKKRPNKSGEMTAWWITDPVKLPGMSVLTTVFSYYSISELEKNGAFVDSRLHKESDSIMEISVKRPGVE